MSSATECRGVNPESLQGGQCSCNELVGHNAPSLLFEIHLTSIWATVDAYRNKMRSSMMAAGTDVTSTAPHLETRAGKRRWLERSRRSKPSGSSS